MTLTLTLIRTEVYDLLTALAREKGETEQAARFEERWSAIAAAKKGAQGAIEDEFGLK